MNDIEVVWYGDTAELWQGNAHVADITSCEVDDMESFEAFVNDLMAERNSNGAEEIEQG